MQFWLPSAPKKTKVTKEARHQPAPSLFLLTTRVPPRVDDRISPILRVFNEPVVLSLHVLAKTGEYKTFQGAICLNNRYFRTEITEPPKKGSGEPLSQRRLKSGFAAHCATAVLPKNSFSTTTKTSCLYVPPRGWTRVH